MIDFTYNSENEKTKKVEYFNTDGRMEQAYLYADLLEWIDKRYSDMLPKEIDAYIDANWIKVSTEFYNHMNNIENAYPMGKQGIYNVSQTQTK